MNKNVRNAIIKYLVVGVIGGLMALGVLGIEGYFSMTEQSEKYRSLCDAFTVPGMIFMLLTGLLFASGGGAFDGIGFALGRFFRMLIPFVQKNDESYAEYRERKRAKGKLHGYSCLLFVGLIFCAVAIVFLVLFYRVYVP